MTFRDLAHAEEFAARMHAVIPGPEYRVPREAAKRWALDRERVESDLRAIRRAEEGLREHYAWTRDGQQWCAPHPPAYPLWPCPDGRRWTEARDEAADNLARTGRLYGVKDRDSNALESEADPVGATRYGSSSPSKQ